MASEKIYLRILLFTLLTKLITNTTNRLNKFIKKKNYFLKIFLRLTLRMPFSSHMYVHTYTRIYVRSTVSQPSSIIYQPRTHRELTFCPANLLNAPSPHYPPNLSTKLSAINFIAIFVTITL